MHSHLPPHTYPRAYTPQLFSELCNKGRLTASWGLGSRGRSSLLPHCSHTATVGVQRVTAAAHTQQDSSPYVVFVEGGGSSVRDAKEHAAALAAEQLLRSLCHSGGSVESVWGNILSRAPGAMQAYGRRLASNLQLAAGQPLPLEQMTSGYPAGPVPHGVMPTSGTAYYLSGQQQQYNPSQQQYNPSQQQQYTLSQQQQYDPQQWHQQQQPQQQMALPLPRKGPEPWQLQVRPGFPR